MATQAPVSRLPFKTAPTVETVVIGDETTGTLEFPVYKDLTVSESAWMASQAAETNTFSHTSRVALKIAKLEKIKPLEAHHFVAKTLAKAMGSDQEFTANEEQWLIKYVRELEMVAIKVVEVSLAQQNLLVTAVIRHRLQGCEDWAVSDTAALPAGLVNAVHSFAVAERNRGEVQTLEEINNELEDALKKSRPAPTKSRKTRTGQKSSIPSDSSTQATQTSPATGSGSSEAATP
ncbi:MAG: hypothetical protein ACPGSE_00510 [Synechococcus sp.]